MRFVLDMHSSINLVGNSVHSAGCHVHTNLTSSFIIAFYTLQFSLLAVILLLLTLSATYI